MKTIYLTSLVLAVFFLTSCEEEPVIPLENDIPEDSFLAENYEGFWNNDIRSTTIDIYVAGDSISISIEGDVWTTKNAIITEEGISFTAEYVVTHNGDSYYMRNDFKGVLTSMNRLDLSIMYVELRRPDWEDYFSLIPKEYGIFTK